MKKLAVLLVAVIILLSGCTASQSRTDASYTQITQEEAKVMMGKDDGHIIVDVRRQDEYDEGHIPGAILIPNESITDKKPSELPDLDQIILVYCRSGRRSKEAAQKLADMGYTNVYEFGGIIDWTGETVMNETETTQAVSSSPVLVIKANGKVFYANLEDNSSAKAFIEKLSPQEMNQLTIYYDENTWSFTRLAKIGNTSKEELLSAFGKGDVNITMNLEWSE